MKKYFRIFWRIWRLSMMQIVLYRANFFFSIVTNFLYGASGIFLVWLLFRVGQVDRIAGFTLYEVYFVVAMAQIVETIGWTLAGSSAQIFRKMIHFGELDNQLIQPVNIVFRASCRYFWVAQIGSTMINVGFLLYITLPELTVSWSALNLILLFIIILMSLVMYWVLFWIASLINFFWPNFTALRIFLDYSVDIVRYPRDVYPRYMVWFLMFMFPLFIVVNPVYLWIKGDYDLSVIGLNAGILVIFVMVYLIMWRGGLKRYNSAN